MFEKVKDMYLKHHTKNLVKKYHKMFGLTADEINLMNSKELSNKVTNIINNFEKENNYFAKMVNVYQEKLTDSQMQNKELQKRFNDLEKRYNESELEKAHILREKLELKLENKMLKNMDNSKYQGKDVKLELVK